MPGTTIDPGKLFITGLGLEVDDVVLEEAFERFGRILKATVVRDKFTGDSKGYGFVQFEDESCCDTAIQEMKDKLLNGNPIHVELAVINDNAGRDGGGHGDYRGRGGYRRGESRGGYNRGYSDRGSYNSSYKPRGGYRSYDRSSDDRSYSYGRPSYSDRTYDSYPVRESRPMYTDSYDYELTESRNDYRSFGSERRRPYSEQRSEYRGRGWGGQRDSYSTRQSFDSEPPYKRMRGGSPKPRGMSRMRDSSPPRRGGFRGSRSYSSYRGRSPRGGGGYRSRGFYGGRGRSSRY